MIDFDYITKSIIENSTKFNLDVGLVRAIVQTESEYRAYAIRYEPEYRYTINVSDFAHANRISRWTEEICQKTSFGIMQVMGGLARELGHKTLLTELIDPIVGGYFGCKYLRQLFDRHGEEREVVAAYNAGSPRKTPGGLFVNQRYVDKVYGLLNEYRKVK